MKAIKQILILCTAAITLFTAAALADTSITAKTVQSFPNTFWSTDKNTPYHIYYAAGSTNIIQISVESEAVNIKGCLTDLTTPIKNATFFCVVGLDNSTITLSYAGKDGYSAHGSFQVGS